MASSPQITARPDVPAYSDTVDGFSIRLLRFWKSEDGELVGCLRTFRLASAPRFYTVSLLVQALSL
jgi:hypothetical protein